MPIEVAITTEGGAQVVSTLEAVEERAGNLQKAFEEIALQIYAEEYMIFQSEGAFRGRPAWPQLDSEYAKQKGRIRGRSGEGATARADDKILQLSGSLKESLTDPHSPFSILNITRESLTVGSKRLVGHKGKSYALGVLHHDGAGTLPVRQALTVVDEQTEEWGRAILEHIAGED